MLTQVFSTRQIANLALLVALVSLAGCAAKKSMESEKALHRNIDYLVREGTRYWEQRTDPEAARKSRTLLEDAFRQRPTDVELCQQVCRSIYFEARYLTENPVDQDSLFLKGSRLAESVLKQLHLEAHPTDSTKDFTSVANQSDQIALLYWWAANFGSYLLTKPIIERLAYREQFEQVLHRLLLLNPNFFYGGPYRLFAVFYARIPGVELSRSGTYFDQAIAAYPEYLASQVLKAQYYLTKTGDREQFHSILTGVVSADASRIPEIMPENKFEQKIAARLLDKESLLFE